MNNFGKVTVTEAAIALMRKCRMNIGKMLSLHSQSPADIDTVHATDQGALVAHTELDGSRTTICTMEEYTNA